MSLDASAFRRAGIRLTTAVGLGLAAILPLKAQTVLVANPPTTSQPAKGFTEGDCAAFGDYILAEDAKYGSKLSNTFFDSTGRFVAAKCEVRDSKGEIQIITETTQDARSLEVALRRMGKVDILGLSGINHCHRPPGGVCPSRTDARARPGVGG